MLGVVQHAVEATTDATHMAATLTCTCHLPCSAEKDKFSCATNLVDMNLSSACLRSRIDSLLADRTEAAG